MIDAKQQTEPAPIRTVASCFPMVQARPKQLEAMAFIDDAYKAGYRDIIIEGATGVGKSGIGVAVCQWANRLEEEGHPGGYYLVTQKLLQDQLTSDFESGKFQGVGYDIKGAAEYVCEKYKDCGTGGRATKPCACRQNGSCPYIQQRSRFVGATTAVTNYPYLFAEHKYVGELPKRKVIICDECHSLPSQLITFQDVRVGPDELEKWRLDLTIPELRNLREFASWLRAHYVPALDESLQIALELAECSPDDEFAREVVKIDQHMCKVNRALDLIRKDPTDWVFWPEEDKDRRINYIARPLDAAPYMKEYIHEMGSLRIYMSAYVGSKELFCRTLGLDPEDVACIKIDSPFPAANRPIVLGYAGSMAMRNVDETMPKFLKFAARLLDNHSDEKGIMHLGSYKLCNAVYSKFINHPVHGSRLLFPRNAKERADVFEAHSRSDKPTVIISPSMTEGFDFNEDLARWQIIGKVAWPFLGDRWVLAKKQHDPDWYVQQAISTVIQATGRVCRSDTDKGVTYILDSDFERIYQDYQSFFPKWYKAAVVRPGKP